MQYYIGDTTILAYNDGTAVADLGNGRIFEFACACEARAAAEQRLPREQRLPLRTSAAPDCIICNVPLKQ